MLKRMWSRLGSALGRFPVGLTLVAGCAALFVLQALFLKEKMVIKVEASDLLPRAHPKNREFEFIRDTFQGSSRGFFVAVEADVVRLREVVPEVARALEDLPNVDFIRWRVEREWFEDSLLLHQAMRHLEAQAGYLEGYKKDVARLMARGASLGDLLDGIASIIDGEQELEAPTDEREKDAKLAKDLESLTPFLVTSRRAIERLAAGQPLDPRFVDRGLEQLLLRGWFDDEDVARLDRELLLPDDVWEKPGPTTALVWVATKGSDLDPKFAKRFMATAERIRGELRARFPDVGFLFTGGIASYNTYVSTVNADFAQAHIYSLIAVLLLLVIGFRSITPFVLHMFFLATGVMGTLVMQNLLFGGVNMIATAGALAVVGIGSDYGVVFRLTFQREMAQAERERDLSGRMTRKQWLRHVRHAISRSLESIGTATTVGCFISAASFLALAGSDVLPLLSRLTGVGPSMPQTFQPIRELGVGSAVGLIYCLVLMLVALPGGTYVVEWVRTHSLRDRLARLTRPWRKRLSKNRRWLKLRGHVRLTLRTDHERRWFRGLTVAVVRQRLWLVGGALALVIAAAVVARGVEWSTGQKEVQPRHSEAVDVSEHVEKVFGKSFENLLVYGPLDVIRNFHTRMQLLAHAPGTNIGEVTSIDDFLPAAHESQERKIELARRIEVALAGVRAPVPGADVVLLETEVGDLAARLGSLDRRMALEIARARPGAAAAMAAARVELALVLKSLARRSALEPASEWSGDLAVVDPAEGAALAAALVATGDAWLEAQKPPAAIAEIKRLGRGLQAASEGGVVPRRDLAAAALALEGLGDPEHAARLRDLAANAPPPPSPVASAHLPRALLREPVIVLEKFVADSGSWGLQAGEPMVFGDMVAVLERALDLVALRVRPERAEVGTALERTAAAAARLRKSLDSLRSFSAASGFASVAPRVPATAQALEELLATLGNLPADRAEAVVRSFDAVFSARLFDRFETVKRAAARTRKPITVDDVPESARRLFSGKADGETLYLARVLPRVSMLARRPYHEAHDAVEGALADVTPPKARAGYSGFEVLLNLATDYLESTFVGAMLAVSLFVLIALYLYNRSLAATLVLIAPVAVGATATLAFMALLKVRITIFTVVAIPIIIGVATDSSIQVFREYWDQLRERGRAPIPDVMAETGKVVTMNSLFTMLPFGVMAFGNMKGLIALGSILGGGLFLCLIAKLTLLPALISLFHDYVIPATQFAHRLYPKRRIVRFARWMLGRWYDALPFPDPGFSMEPLPEERILLQCGRRPPLNLTEAALASEGVVTDRKFLADPEFRAMIKYSGLPWHYQVKDSSGELVLDARGKPKRIAAAIAENEILPSGFELVGPMRTFGAGADLKLMMQNPVNAIFTLKGAVEEADVLWYAPKPMVFVAEGDVIAGWFEYALLCNFVITTRNARFGAPEVRRGLTLPYGAHALLYRTGNATTQHLMATGDMISGEEAVRLGVADLLVPDGEDAMQFALKLCQSQEFHDRVQQTAILRQYGPPMRSLVEKSIKNYIRLLRSPATRKRIKEFLKEDA